MALAARAQQPLPVIGYLRSTPSAPFAHLTTAFHQGLNEAGFVEGQNIAIDYRHGAVGADHQSIQYQGRVNGTRRPSINLVRRMAVVDAR